MTINPHQPLGAYKLATLIRKRLQKMTDAKPKDILKAASQIAEAGIKTEDKAEGNPKSITPSQCGKELIKQVAGTIAVATNPQTAKAVVSKTIQDERTIKEKIKKAEKEEYGDSSPTLFEIVLHRISNFSDRRLTRREFLAEPIQYGQKVIRESGPELLPFPLNKVARIFGIFKWWGNNSEKAQTVLQSPKT